MPTSSVLHSPRHLKAHDHTHKEKAVAYVSHWAVIVGRALFAAIFIMASFHHFTADAIGYAQNQGVPFASFFVPLSGLMALVGGLSILFAYKVKIGALLIMASLVPVTLMMHNFWAVSDPMMAQIQQAHFMKNLALLGTAILIYQFAPELPYRGPRSLRVVGI